MIDPVNYVANHKLHSEQVFGARFQSCGPTGASLRRHIHFTCYIITLVHQECNFIESILHFSRSKTSFSVWFQPQRRYCNVVFRSHFTSVCCSSLKDYAEALRLPNNIPCQMDQCVFKGFVIIAYSCTHILIPFYFIYRGRRKINIVKKTRSILKRLSDLKN